MTSPYDDADFRQPLTKLKQQFDTFERKLHSQVDVLEDMILQMNSAIYKLSSEVVGLKEHITYIQRDLSKLEDEVYE